MIEFATPDEHALAGPSVIIIERLLLMAFACRGAAYRIATGASDDGVAWTRLAADKGLAPSTQGWDSEMTCYRGAVS